MFDDTEILQTIETCILIEGVVLDETNTHKSLEDFLQGTLADAKLVHIF